MEAEISAKKEEQVGVHVFDDDGRQHGVVLTSSGDIEHHKIPESIPAEVESRTKAQRNLVAAVQLRARYTAHQETEFETLKPSWDPESIREAIDVIESLPAGEFERLFADTYRILQDPPVDVPLENVDVMVQKLRLDGHGGFADVSDVLILATRNGEYQFINEAADPEWEADAVIALPPMEFEFQFGDQFRGYLIHHLKCQIRDIYYRMGEEPPADYQLEGIGKMPTQSEVEAATGGEGPV